MNVKELLTPHPPFWPLVPEASFKSTSSPTLMDCSKGVIQCQTDRECIQSCSSKSYVCQKYRPGMGICLKKEMNPSEQLRRCTSSSHLIPVIQYSPTLHTLVVDCIVKDPLIYSTESKTQSPHFCPHGIVKESKDGKQVCFCHKENSLYAEFYTPQRENAFTRHEKTLYSTCLNMSLLDDLMRMNVENVDVTLYAPEEQK